MPQILIGRFQSLFVLGVQNSRIGTPLEPTGLHSACCTVGSPKARLPLPAHECTFGSAADKLQRRGQAAAAIAAARAVSRLRSGAGARSGGAAAASAFCAASSSASSRLGECLRACAVRYGRLCISVSRLTQRSLEKPRLSSTTSRSSPACKRGRGVQGPYPALTLSLHPVLAERLFTAVVLWAAQADGAAALRPAGKITGDLEPSPVAARLTAMPCLQGVCHTPARAGPCPSRASSAGNRRRHPWRGRVSVRAPGRPGCARACRPA